MIAHRAKVTTLGLKQVNETVNLESDLIGKYVERLLQERGQLPQKPAPVIDRDYLREATGSAEKDSTVGVTPC